MLIGARFVQGVGGALTSAVILGMIVTMFPEPGEQAKAIGVYSFVASAGALDRPAARRRAHRGDQLALDLLRQPADRRSPRRCSRCACSSATRASACGEGADVAGARAGHRRADARRLHDRRGRRATAGARLHTLGLGAIVAGAARRLHRPRGDARATPLVPLRIFRSRNVSGANLVQALMVAGLFGMFFLGALYMQRVLGYGALEIGLAFLPVALLIGVLSLGFSARLIMRFGAAADAAARAGR